MELQSWWRMWHSSSESAVCIFSPDYGIVLGFMLCKRHCPVPLTQTFDWLMINEVIARLLPDLENYFHSYSNLQPSEWHSCNSGFYNAPLILMAYCVRTMQALFVMLPASTSHVSMQYSKLTNGVSLILSCSSKRSYFQSRFRSKCIIL